jgi:hypothetical protein
MGTAKDSFTVFISSTYADLVEHREAVHAAGPGAPLRPRPVLFRDRNPRPYSLERPAALATSFSRATLQPTRASWAAW